MPRPSITCRRCSASTATFSRASSPSANEQLGTVTGRKAGVCARSLFGARESVGRRTMRLAAGLGAVFLEALLEGLVAAREQRVPRRDAEQREERTQQPPPHDHP